MTPKVNVLTRSDFASTTSVSRRPLSAFLMLEYSDSFSFFPGFIGVSFGLKFSHFTSRDFHPVIDISAPRGTKILAPADGVVVAVGRRRAYGKAIIIEHGHGTLTRYGHLDSYNVRPGQRVRRGDVIGFVGNTGRSNAPHLHYEVWVGDKTQNPIHYILEEYRSFG